MNPFPRNDVACVLLWTEQLPAPSASTGLGLSATAVLLVVNRHQQLYSCTPHLLVGSWFHLLLSTAVYIGILASWCSTNCSLASIPRSGKPVPAMISCCVYIILPSPHLAAVKYAQQNECHTCHLADEDLLATLQSFTLTTLAQLLGIVSPTGSAAK